MCFLLRQCFVVCVSVALRPCISLQSRIQGRENVAKSWRMNSHFTNFNFWAGCFPAFFLKKLQSPIMRSYVKCCKIQVPRSCLSDLLWILLHIVMQSWGFTGLCILEGCLSRGLLSEECSILGQTHPLHVWQDVFFKITVVVSLSCIKCVLICFKSLAFRGTPQIPSSPLSNKLKAFKVAYCNSSFDLESGVVYRKKMFTVV